MHRREYRLREASQQRRMAHRLMRTILAAALGAGLLTISTPEAHAARGLTQEAFIPVPSATVQVFVDPSPDARLLYVFDLAAETVTVRSADPGYEVLGSVVLPFPGVFGSRKAYEPLAAVDPVNHRLFVAGTVGGITGKNVVIFIVDGLAVAAGDDDAVTGPIPINHPTHELSNPPHAWPPNPRAAGLSYNVARDLLYLVVEESNFGSDNGLVVVDAVDPTNCLVTEGCPETGQGFLKWSHPVDGCLVPIISAGNLPGVPADAASDGVYVACTYPSSQSTGPRSRQGVFRLETDGTRRPSSQSFAPLPGDYQFGGVIFDPTSERMILFSRRFGPFGNFVFDGRNMTTFGIVKATGNLRGVCLDESIGRYYVLSDTPNAVSTGEARATPAQAGTQHREFFDEDIGPGSRVMACDAHDGRAFVPAQGDDIAGEGVDHALMVITDENPPLVPRPTPNPDALTQDIPDDPSQSRATYNSIGRAFGVRVHETGGLKSWTRSYGIEGFEFGLLSPLLSPFSPATGTIDEKADREVTFAVVGKDERSVSLSNGGPQAAATGGGHDEATQNNFTGNGDHQSPWPFTDVSCPDAEAGNEASTRGAWVACRPTPGDDGEPPGAEAFAEAGQGNMDSGQMEAGGFSFEGAEAHVDTHLDEELGIVTTAHTSVRSLALGGGRIVVEDVMAEARATARGLPGSAKTGYARSVGRLLIDGNEICAPCDPENVAAQITAATDGIVAASIPKADADLRKGTPRGAMAAVIRDPFEQLSDQTVNGFAPYDQHVPALRLTIQPRGFQHNVVIVDLAAPQVVSFRALSPCPFCGFVPSTEPPPAAGGGDSPPEMTDSTSIPVDAELRVAASIEMPVAGGETTTYITEVVSTGRAAGGGGGGLGGIVERVFEAVRKGLDTLLTSPGKIPMLLAVWGLMLSPIYLSARRRLILLRQQHR